MEPISLNFQPFFEWLWRATLQASLLICLILMIQLVLGTKLGVRWRYCLWLLLLIRMALPWAPQSRLSLSNVIPQRGRQAPIEYARRAVADDSAGSGSPGVGVGESTPVSATKVTQDTAEAATSSPDVPKEAGRQLRTHSLELADVLPLVWLAGALILGVYVCANNFTLLSIVRRQRLLTDQKILELLEDCKSQMGIRTILGLVVSDKVKSPALFGFVRPRLLLPKGMLETLSREELRHVFLHELGHLKRHDIYLGWLMSLLQVLHWFNPLIWLAFYRMRADRELACDALVLARTQSGQARDYGRTIVSLLERFSRSQALPAMAGILETKTELKRRIKMIARFKKNSYQWSPLAVILIIIVGCVSLPDAERKEPPGVSAAKPSGMVVRRIEAVGLEGFGGLSPDGRYKTYVGYPSVWETGDLAVCEITTGKKRRLTNKGAESSEFAGPSVFSPDGKQVAYTWYNKDNFFELRTVGLDGSEPRVLYPNRDARPKPHAWTKPYEWPKPYAWSPDGKHVLAILLKKDRTKQIALVSVADGSARTLKSLGWSPTKMDFSPDGRFIVYDDWTEIHVLATDGSGETTLIDHPAAERLLGWSPDGKWILFTSDRRGTWDAWAVQISDGKPQGSAQLVKLNIGQVFPMGFTRDGSFYYSTFSGRISNVYTATIDVEAGKVLTKPANITRHQAGENTFAGWSPDGKWVAYFSQPYVYAKIPPRSTIVIRNVETGEEREINPKKILVVDSTGGRWSPDGRSLLLVGQRKEGRGVYRIDVQSGEVTALIHPGRRAGYPVLSSDGKVIYYIQQPVIQRSTQRAQESSRIVARELESGQERELARRATIARRARTGLALSPDGKHLAFFAQDEAKQSMVLRIVPVGEGETRELFHVQEPESVRGAPAWARDGRQLLFIVRSADQGTHTLWRVSAEDGKAQKFDLAMRGLNHVHMHPDGKQIAFSAPSAQSAKTEVWVMENFLPAGE